MFCLEHLHTLREAEISTFSAALPQGGRILEIGGGTGLQAKTLAERGFSIVSIDIENSNYANQKVFPVEAYDGTHIPYPDASFDVVFSSNTLEHVPHLPALQQEIRRVLKPGGFCLHALPTGAWRFWTSAAHYVEMLQRVWLSLFRSNRPVRHRLQEAMGVVRHYALPPRHGERGNVWSEIYYFSRFWWRNHFVANQFAVVSARPMGVFYTGHMVLGKRLSLPWRKKLAALLGSACIMYKTVPATQS